jgi:hypothetical protein
MQRLHTITSPCSVSARSDAVKSSACSLLASCTVRRANQSHICTGTGPTPPTSAPGLRLAAATSAPGPGSPLPHLHRHRGSHPCHICTGAGLTAATSAQGPGSPLPHLRRDRTLDRLDRALFSGGAVRSADVVTGRAHAYLLIVEARGRRSCGAVQHLVRLHTHGRIRSAPTSSCRHTD